jgi:hypothetical protein
MTPAHLPFGKDGRIHPSRAPFEFYPTPPEGIRALLSVESFDGSVWEPACGDGAIARELIGAGYDVIATDLVDHGYGEAGVDFLIQRAPRTKHIITNPPYGDGLADRFIGQALRLTRHTGGSVAMLLMLSSLCHPLRNSKFLNTPPAAIYGLDELVCFPNGIHDPNYARRARERFCWVVWKPGHAGRPSFWWLSTARFLGPQDNTLASPRAA